MNLKEGISKKYLYQYLKQYQNNIMRLRVGSGLPNIQKSAIISLRITIPSKIEQQKIASFLISLDGSIEAIEKKIERSSDFKKGLLQKMFV